jgi:hypothetical protein
VGKGGGLMEKKKSVREVLKPKYCIYDKMECDICSATCGISQALAEIEGRVVPTEEQIKRVCQICLLPVAIKNETAGGIFKDGENVITLARQIHAMLKERVGL